MSHETPNSKNLPNRGVSCVARKLDVEVQSLPAGTYNLSPATRRTSTRYSIHPTPMSVDGEPITPLNIRT
ncbi:hypothetical protein [Spirosoma linguale]|uniref:hypothetical protein n=1 Tax=Spirosoma linguale TaxID=108 RepID=UPI003CC80517